VKIIVSVYQSKILCVFTKISTYNYINISYIRRKIRIAIMYLKFLYINVEIVVILYNTIKIYYIYYIFAILHSYVTITQFKKNCNLLAN